MLLDQFEDIILEVAPGLDCTPSLLPAFENIMAHHLVSYGTAFRVYGISHRMARFSDPPSPDDVPSIGTFIHSMSRSLIVLNPLLVT